MRKKKTRGGAEPKSEKTSESPDDIADHLLDHKWEDYKDNPAYVTLAFGQAFDQYMQRNSDADNPIIRALLIRDFKSKQQAFDGKTMPEIIAQLMKPYEAGVVIRKAGKELIKIEDKDYYRVQLVLTNGNIVSVIYDDKGKRAGFIDAKGNPHYHDPLKGYPHGTPPDYRAKDLESSQHI